MKTAPPRPPSEGRLSPEQVRQFHAQGFLAPLTACSPEEMGSHRKHAERLTAGPDHEGLNLHLIDRTIFELSSLPAMVGAMQSVLGEDLLLWRTVFFKKEPGGREIPWHQDRNFWPLEPEIVLSAWLAIDRADVENSCVQVIPGTHRKLIKHVKSPSGMEFGEMADFSEAGIDLAAKVDVILEPGQFLLFNERTLHHSEINRSNRRRMGLAIRVIIPQVRVLPSETETNRVIQLSGQDRMDFNEHVQPPSHHDPIAQMDRAAVS